MILAALSRFWSAKMPAKIPSRCGCYRCRIRQEIHSRLSEALDAALKDNWIPIEALLTEVFEGNPVQAWKSKDEYPELYFG